MTKKTPKVLFSINCYEKDYKILNDEFEYRFLMCDYPFSEVWMTINNVSNEKKVAKLFKGRATRVIIASEIADEALSFFKLDKNSFSDGVNDGYNYSINSIIDLYLADKFDYLCHYCSDVTLKHRSNWITPGILEMESEENCAGARPGLPRYELPEKYTRTKIKVLSDHAYLIPVYKFRNPGVMHVGIPTDKDVHAKDRGDIFERKITRYLGATNQYIKIIKAAEEIHPCYCL